MIVLCVFVCVLLVLVFMLALSWVFEFAEYAYCTSIKKQPPLVASCPRLRQSVVEQILKHYSKSKNICEIGSGFGGLARAVARNTDADVYALENMPYSALVSKICDVMTGCKNNHTIWCDAFEYLKNTDCYFDVALAYMGPTATPLIQNYKNKIGVLISLDFEIKGLRPIRVVDLSDCGYVVYNRVKYPHRLYVYRF